MEIKCLYRVNLVIIEELNVCKTLLIHELNIWRNLIEKFTV